MTVPITGSVKDVTGVEDNDTPWSFASVIRFAEDGSVITEKPREVRAVSGNLKVNLVPGYAIVTYGKHVWQVTVPTTATTLKALIEAGVAFPPDTAQTLLNEAVGAYVEANRQQFRSYAVPVEGDPGMVQWYDAAGTAIGDPVPQGDVISTEVAQSVATAAAEVVTPGIVTADIEARAPQVIVDPDNPTTHARVQIGDAVGPPMPYPGNWGAIPGKPAVIAAGSTAAAARTAIGATTVGAEVFTAADAAAARASVSAVGRGELVVYARHSGVVSDGTTNDLSALNALINTVSDAGGGTILLPSNSITKVNGSIVVKSNVEVRGQGWNSVIKLGANINGYGVFHIAAGVSNAVIADLKIDCDRTNLTQTNYGIQGEVGGGYSNITVRNVWVHSPQGGGIVFLGDTTRAVATTNIKILDCLVTDAGYLGIDAQWGVDRCWIERCSVIGHGLVTADAPGIVNGRHAYDTWIVDCYVDSTGATGVQPHSISYDTAYGRFTCRGNTVVNAVAFGIEIAFCTDGTVTGNNVVGGAKAGIKLTNNQNITTCMGVVVSDNTLDGCAGGIELYMGNATSGQDVPAARTVVRAASYLSAAASNRIIDGRRLYRCTTAGTTHATVKPAAWGTTVTGDTITDGTAVFTDQGMVVSNVTIQGNIIRNITGTGNGEGTGITLRYAALVNVMGNIITNCAKSGIFIEATANMFEIIGNTIQGNNTLADANHAGLRITASSGTAHTCKIAHNRILNNAIGEVVVTDSASSVRIDNRIPAGTTIPTVAYGTVFFTQNTSATTITGFIDANAHDHDDRTIRIRVADANTTFQHSASGSNTLRLNGGVNYAAPSGTVMQFAWSSQLNQWMEMSRNAIG